MNDYEQAYRDLMAGMEALAARFDEIGWVRAADLCALLASSAPATASEGATCGARVCSADYTHGPHRHDDGVLTLTGVTSSDGDRGLSEEERSYGRTDPGLQWRGRWYSEASVERILAARTAQPEGSERVEWGVRYEHGVAPQSSEDSARYNAQRFNATMVTRRPAGPWEVVGDE